MRASPSPFDATATRAAMADLLKGLIDSTQPPEDTLASLTVNLARSLASPPFVGQALMTREGATEQDTFALMQLRDALRGFITHTVSEWLRAEHEQSKTLAAPWLQNAADAFLRQLLGALCHLDLFRPTDEQNLEGLGGAVVTQWRLGMQSNPPQWADDEAETPERAAALVKIDARPAIAAGNDPLESILEAVKNLPAHGVLLLIAPFEPRPMIALLRKRNFHVDVEEMTDPMAGESPPKGTKGLWAVEASMQPVDDLRDLPAPEPLEAVLLKLSSLTPGAAFAVRLPQPPRLLFPRLRDKQTNFECMERPDGSAIVWIQMTAGDDGP